MRWSTHSCLMASTTSTCRRRQTESGASSVKAVKTVIIAQNRVPALLGLPDLCAAAIYGSAARCTAYPNLSFNVCGRESDSYNSTFHRFSSLFDAEMASPDRFIASCKSWSDFSERVKALSWPLTFENSTHIGGRTTIAIRLARSVTDQAAGFNELARGTLPPGLALADDRY